MEILRCNRFIKVWKEENPTILYSKILKALYSDDLQEYSSQYYLNIIEYSAITYGKVYEICDASSLQKYSFALFTSHLRTIITRQVNVGLALKAIVKPHDLRYTEDLVTIMESIDGLPVAIFDSIQDATEFVRHEIDIQKNQFAKLS